MTARSRSLLSKLVSDVLPGLFIACACGGFTFYVSTTSVQAQAGTRLDQHERRLDDHDKVLADVRDKLSKVAEDTAYMRGHMDRFLNKGEGR